MSNKRMSNIREAFKHSDSNVLYAATPEQALILSAAYFVGLAPFMRLSGLDVLWAAG